MEKVSDDLRILNGGALLYGFVIGMRFIHSLDHKPGIREGVDPEAEWAIEAGHLEWVENAG